MALRRKLSSANIRVHETRSLAECWEELADYPRSLLALEARSDNVAELVERLADLRSRYPKARALALLDGGPGECEWLLREAGAVHVARSTPALRAAVRLVRRHLETHTGGSHEDLQSYVQDRLPWPPRP